MGSVCSECNQKLDFFPNTQVVNKDLKKVIKIQSWFKGYKIRLAMMSLYRQNSVKVCEILGNLSSFDSIISKIALSKGCPSFSTGYFYSLREDVLSWYRSMFSYQGELNYPSVLVEKDFIIKSKAEFIFRFKYFIIKQLNYCFDLDDYFLIYYQTSIRDFLDGKESTKKKSKSKSGLLANLDVTKLINFKFPKDKQALEDLDLKKEFIDKNYLSKESILKNKQVNTLSSGSQARTPKSVAFSVSQANKICINNDYRQLSLTSDKLVQDLSKDKDRSKDSKKSVPTTHISSENMTFEIINVMKLLEDFDSSKKPYYIGLKTTDDQDSIFHGQYNRLDGKKMGLGLLVKLSDLCESEDSKDSSILLKSERKRTIIDISEITPRIKSDNKSKVFNEHEESPVKIISSGKKSLIDKMREKMTPIDSQKNDICKKSIKSKSNPSTKSLAKANISAQSIYLGFFQDDIFSGYGMSLSSCGKSYFGEYRIGKQNGYGIEKTSKHEYSGTFRNSKYCGFGELIWKSNRCFFGCFKDGKKDGIGYEVYEDGSYYVGFYSNNKLEGIGFMSWSNGNRYFGNWAEGKMDGFGKYYMKNGDRYIGSYKNDKKHGIGKYLYNTSQSTLTGVWENGLKQGIFDLFDGSQIFKITYKDNNQT